ncbi:hypothetical protein HW45_02975 [Vibrio sp. ER1A]|nr:hypothetical protein HW45_02975 [Vibrio sp. ER1A]
MDSKSQYTVDIISKVIDSKITINSATQLLQKSRGTVERYMSRYRKEGIRFVIRGNTGRTHINKIPESLKKEVQNLIQTKYYDFNLQHLSELLSENEDLSISVIEDQDERLDALLEAWEVVCRFCDAC